MSARWCTSARREGARRASGRRGRPLQTPGAQISDAGEYSIMTPARLTGNEAHYTLRAEPGQLTA
jgi:hypothetical protein